MYFQFQLKRLENFDLEVIHISRFLCDIPVLFPVAVFERGMSHIVLKCPQRDDATNFLYLFCEVSKEFWPKTATSPEGNFKCSFQKDNKSRFEISCRLIILLVTFFAASVCNHLPLLGKLFFDEFTRFHLTSESKS